MAVLVQAWVFAFAGPAKAATTGLSVSSVDVYSNSVSSQIVTVGDGLTAVTVTVPSEFLPIVYVSWQPGTCTRSDNVFTCSGGRGELEVRYVTVTSALPGLADNESRTTTAEAAGFKASGTVTVRRTANIGLTSASEQLPDPGNALISVNIFNKGPDGASNVRIALDGVDPQALVFSNACTRAGTQVICDVGTVPVYGAFRSFNISRCAALNAITVTLSTTTTDLDSSDNARTLPAAPDAGRTCAEVFGRPAPGAGGSGGGTGGSGGSGGTGGSGGSGSGGAVGDDGVVPIDASTSPVASASAGATTPAPTATRSTPAPDGRALAAQTAGGTSALTIAIGTAVAVLLLGAAAGGWVWRRQRRPTG